MVKWRCCEDCDARLGAAAKGCIGRLCYIVYWVAVVVTKDAKGCKLWLRFFET